MTPGIKGHLNSILHSDTWYVPIAYMYMKRSAQRHQGSSYATMETMYKCCIITCISPSARRMPMKYMQIAWFLAMDCISSNRDAGLYFLCDIFDPASIFCSACYWCSEKDCYIVGHMIRPISECSCSSSSFLCSSV